MNRSTLLFKTRSIRTIPAVLGCTGALAVTTSATANLLSESDLTGQAAGQLHAVDDGFGWGGEWKVQEDDTANYSVATTAPLSYLTLENSGPRIAGGGGFRTIRRDLPTDNGSIYGNAGLVSDVFSERNIDTGTQYVSFLLRRDGAGQIDIALTDGLDNIHNNNSSDYSFGIQSTGSDATYSLRYETSSNPSGSSNQTPSHQAAAITGKTSVLGATDLIVLRVQWGTEGDLNTQTLIDAWVNPTSLGGAAPNSDLQVSYDGADDGYKLFMARLGTGAGTASLDAVRIGTTYAAVTPIPEPASLVLLGLGGLMMIGRRRQTAKN